jgi:hypothetical protein
VLTVAFHGCGRLGCGGLLVVRRTTGSVAVVPARKMLLAVTSFDAAAASSSTDHHHHHHRRQHHQHHQHHQHVHGQWNRQGIPPSSAVGKAGKDEIDPRYGVQKRLVPTGPNPLHH